MIRRVACVHWPAKAKRSSDDAILSSIINKCQTKQTLFYYGKVVGFGQKAQADTYDDLQNPAEPLDVDSE